MVSDRKPIDEKQRTIAVLRQMQARIDAAENRNREPIAIIGVGCRLPGGARSPAGVRTADAFWGILQDGVDAVREVPAERWDASAFFDPDPAAPGKMNTRWGGFIDDVDKFDPGFFGISPREAVSMDPQQRLVLEVAWRALENAGIPANDLVGSKTGVFLGVCTSDYARLGDASGSRGTLDTYSGTGGSTGVTAGRLSYALGLNGPSLVVDTACSSSLVAIHLAVNGLRNRECDLAIAGGVNLVLLPDGTITLSKLHMMAPDGRCKAFDASGDGFVRGEGCGLVVLQRLRDAQAQGARILAVISGSAVNQDGRSSGLTAPSGTAQERVIRDALANANKSPRDVGYIEAHGTGTSLGDPIELDALQNVFGGERSSALVVGSVKSNIGHLEAAAGIAGLIKTIGVLRSGRVPANLHFQTLNPNVAGGAPAIRIAGTPMALPGGGPMVAGVSSFGFSGTNAHLVVEAAPEQGSIEPALFEEGKRTEVFVLSGRSASAVERMASVLAKDPPTSLADAAYTLATGRSRFDYRMALVAKDAAELKAALAQGRVVEKGRIRVAVVVAGGAGAGQDARLAEISASLARIEAQGIPVDALIAATAHDLAGVETAAASAPRAVAGTPEAAEILHAGRINCAILLSDEAENDGIEALLSASGEKVETWRMGSTAQPDGLARLTAFLFERGAEIDWARRYRGESRRRVDVPGHPFERQRYWRDRDGVAAGRTHPLVGQRIDLPGGRTLFRSIVRDPANSHLGQHRVAGTVIVSAAAMLEAIASVAVKTGRARTASEVTFESALALDAPREILIETNGHDVEICSRLLDGSGEIRHLRARLGEEQEEIAALPAVGRSQGVDPEALYAWYAEGGLEYGPDYRRIVLAERDGATARIRIRGSENASHLIDPAVLDCALQSLGVVTFGRSGAMRIPATCARFQLSQERPVGDVTATTRVTIDGARVVADIQGVDETGRTVLAIVGLTLARADAARDWRESLFERAWVSRAYPKRPDAIVAVLEDALGQRIAERGLAPLADLGGKLDALAASFAKRVLRDVPPHAVNPEHESLYALLSGWPEQALEEPGLEIEALRRDYPDNAGEIDLLVRCGEALPDVLRGRRNPLDLIFSESDEAGIYADPPVSRLLNDAATDAVLAALPEDGPIRILEVGAGTGATTQAILARLPQERVALYRFTDIAPGLVSKARLRFGQNGWFAASTFDLDADVEAEGIGGDYDIIVAANVLHATRDLTRTLSRLRGLLRPGGALVALEGAGPQGWVDLVFGMTKGWWAFEDHEARGGHPMPRRNDWLALLRAAGFDAGLSDADTAGLVARQTVIVARPSRAPTWSVIGTQDDLSQGIAAVIGDGSGDHAMVARGGAVLVAPRSAGKETDEDFIDTVAGTLDEIRRVALDAAAISSRMALVTCGAFDGDMAAAAAWGLGRAIAAEYPKLRLISIDVDPAMDRAAAAAAVAEALASDDFEDQVRIGPAGRAVARLQAVEPCRTQPVAIERDGLHVVTGGFGGLGLASAARLVALGARRLLLVGRSPPSVEAQAAIAQLVSAGAAVRCEIADVARPKEVDAIFSGLDERVAGILHCAGSLDDRSLALLDAKSFAGLLGPKAGGCANLERHCPDADYFVMYSSAIGLVGAAGQANHIAANAMLDAFAVRRREAGLPAASLAFAAWSEIGSASSPGLAARMRESGLGTIAPSDGLAVVEWAISGEAPPVTAVLPIEREGLAERSGAALPPLFRALARPATGLPADGLPPVEAQRSPAHVASPDVGSRSNAEHTRRAGARVLDIVLSEAAEVLAAEGASAIDARSSLFAQGFDSLMAVELRNRLQHLFGKPLPSTLLFDYSAPADLARFLGGTPDLPDEAPDPAAGDAPRDAGDIAIVGMACRFPAGANDLETFWRLLRQGYDGVRPWPADRPIPDDRTPGHAAYIDDVGAFDAGFFKISPREAVSMDPQQRLLLETAWHALEDAAIPADGLAGTSTGVYVGLCNHDYAQVAAEAGGIDAWSGTGGAPSIAAGRIAFALGLEGPALVVDTACSSSLVALHLAARALADGDCDTALACAANLILSPSTTDALQALNMLAPDGRCKAFDARADGFGRGEGVGALVLKRASDALRDGDRILATIRAAVVNQDGRSSSLTAPSGRAQVALMRNALVRSSLSPHDIDYVEAHGTGTALGDPIEIGALRDVYAHDRPNEHPLIVGAVKSNVAHLEAAAGMAGLIKTVLALNEGTIPPNVHFDALNPHIDLADAAITFPRDLTPWPTQPGRKRRAGVSSFGFSGTNVHVVLEQAAEPNLQRHAGAVDSGPKLLILSAASAMAARRLAQRLADRLRGGDDDDMRLIADNLLKGRAQLGWRIAVVARTAAEAAAAIAAAEPIDAQTYGEIAETVRFPGVPSAEDAARLFLSGASLWPSDDFRPAHVKLPLYPFERTVHWFEAAPKARAVPGPSASHPLLGRRQRRMGGGRGFEAEISAGSPPWLGDHRVAGRAVLPAAAMLDIMACASGEGPLTLVDIHFEAMLDVTEPTSLLTTFEAGALQIHAAPIASEDWSRIAAARRVDFDNAAHSGSLRVEEDCGESLPIEALYAGFLGQGIAYGRAFRAISELRCGEGVALAALTLPEGVHPDGFRLHPVLLDAAFQSIAAAARRLDVKGRDFRPAGISQFSLVGLCGRQLMAHSRARVDEAGDIFADIRLENLDSTPVAFVSGLRLQPTYRIADESARLYDVVWEPLEHFEDCGGTATIVHHVVRDCDPEEAVAVFMNRVKPLIAESGRTRLVLLTEGAETLAEDTHPADVAGAAVRGFCASLAIEHPEFTAVAIDIAPGVSSPSDAWPREAGQYALRNGRLLGRRLIARPVAASPARALVRPESGRLQDLHFENRPLAMPGPGEIAITVAAAGLNFRDVMNTLKLYPGDAGALGGECAGYVDAIGAGVTGFELGMPVMAISSGCHATRVIARAALTWPIPDGWSLEEAASAPTVYLSAAALRDEGGLGPGTSVLVHAATGGVGMAAIALARNAGARVLATAGSPEKRNFLLALGIETVADSRSPSFAADIMTATDGVGVDIVLNSLSGEMIAAGFDVLKPGGRFLELGKAGIWDEPRAAAYRPDIRYRRIVLDDEIVSMPERVGQNWQALAAEIATGGLAALPTRSFPLQAATDAYRFMQEARHIGRIALTRRRFDANASYVVTGGSGALGMAVARRLAEQGARHLVLVSRGLREIAPICLARLSNMGVSVVERHLDLSQPEAVAQLIAGIPQPIGGIVHASGVLADGVVAGMSREQLHIAFAAKLDSAVHLDRATRDLPHAFFVVFSSAAGIFGSAGQANYAAANAGLDALMQNRRAAGLPGVSIDWGAWRSGMAAGRAGAAMPEEVALAAFDMILDGNDAQVVVLPDEAGGGSADAPIRAAQPLLRGLLEGAASGERLGIIRRAIVNLVAEDMRIPPGEISLRRPLDDYGLDSLLAVQMRNSLSALVGETMPASMLYDYPTVSALADFVLARFASATTEAEPTSAPVAATDPGAASKQPGDGAGEEDPTEMLLQELERAGY